MTNQSLEDWFSDWWRLCLDVKHHFSGGVPGNKAKALAEVKKLKPAPELRQQIVEYTQSKAMIWTKKKNAGQRVRDWQDGERLIKYKFWEDPLPSVTEAADQDRPTTQCQCGKTATHRIADRMVCCGCWYEYFRKEDRILGMSTRLKAEWNTLGIKKGINWREPCLKALAGLKFSELIGRE